MTSMHHHRHYRMVALATQQFPRIVKPTNSGPVDHASSGILGYVEVKDKVHYYVRLCFKTIHAQIYNLYFFT